VETGLSRLGSPQPPGNIAPVYSDFAAVRDAGFSAGWSGSLSLHGSAVESGPIPGSEGLGVKVYQDPLRGQVAAVTPVPWYGPAHLIGAYQYAQGVNVNSGYAASLLTDPLWQYNVFPHSNNPYNDNKGK
jgi:hypothetical protein